MEHERLNRCCAIAALKKASYAMRWVPGNGKNSRRESLERYPSKR
jgi:hypothetical protein